MNKMLNIRMPQSSLLRFVILVAIFFSYSAQSDLFSQISFSTGSSYKYLKGSQASTLASDWVQPSFNDASWASGNAPFRYGDGTGGTELTDMQYSYSTVYLRTTFTASNASQIKQINFSADYDDGFIIWVNGQEVFRRSTPEIPAYNAFASELHESGTPVLIQVDLSMINLVEGINTLAVQCFNTSLESSDFYFDLSINAQPALQEVKDTIGISFSRASGFYTSAFSLTLVHPDNTASIVYTLDGSNPQTSTTAITAANNTTISINPASTANRPATPAVIVRASIKKGSLVPSIPISRTFIFTDRVKTQTNPGGSWPSYDVNGQVIDLDMDSKVINDSRYTSLITTSLLDIPSISIITDNADLFDPSSGIYVNAWGHGIDWERLCSMELINPDGSAGFNVNAGIRIRGGWSRHNDFPKHAFRLFFREEYGASKLKYPLFGDEGVSEFDKIDLRADQNYAWANGEWNGHTMVREVFSRDCQRDMGQPYTRSRYYHLYLNGMYWGVYQSQERSEARFAADYLGGSREDYDVIKVSTENWNYQIEATDGQVSTWQNLYNLCSQGFASNESYFRLEGKNADGKPVPGMEVLVDIDNLIDYMLTIFYAGNFDAPVSAFGGNSMPNNFYAIYNRNDKSKGFVFFNHDGEHSMMIDARSPGVGLYENRVTIDNLGVNGISGFHPQWLHEKLMANEEYRIRFADHVAKHMTANGALTPAKCLERLNKRVDEIDMAIIAESARWGDSKKGTACTKDDHWLPEINRLRTRFVNVRTNIVLDQLEEAGIWSTLLPPKISKGGVELKDLKYSIISGETISIQNPNSSSEVYYTFDGSDPRRVGGAISEKAIKFSGETIKMNGSTLIKARSFKNGNWSGLKEMTFVSKADDLSNLKVTELFYHPQDIINGTDTASGKWYEFIEFKNTGETALNLSGLVLDSAVYYVFPENTILPPSGFYVIATKPKYFFERYGLNPSGNCQDYFANSGEYVLLTDANGNEILSFTYSDDKPWPKAADGDDYSLVATERFPTGDPNDYLYWTASSVKRGSPFTDDQKFLNVEPVIISGIGGLYSVFPNPSNGLVYIKSNQDEMADAEISVFDMKRIMLHQINAIGNTMLDLNSITVAPGVYIISITTNKGVETYRIIYTP